MGWFTGPPQIGRHVFERCLLLLLLVQAQADVVVAPNEFENKTSEGALNAFAGSGARWLSLYNPTEFVGAMPQGGTIDQISFRIDERDRNTFLSTIPDIEIKMSTSPSLSPVIPVPFSESVGPDETIVFPRGSAQVSVVPSASGPNPFNVTFRLKQPFSYDPRRGSLAVDLWIYESASHRLLIDTADTGEDGGSIGGSVNNPRSTTGSGAFIMQLRFAPIPEPAAWVICTVGAVLLFGVARRKNL